MSIQKTSLAVFTLISLLLLSGCEKKQEADQVQGFLSETSLTELDSIELESVSEKIVIKQFDDGWKITEPYALLATYARLQTALLALQNTSLSQEVHVSQEGLNKLGLSPDLENSNYLSLQLSFHTERPKQRYILGNFNQPFDKTMGAVFGEAVTARRYVYHEATKKVFLVDYPFHELSADYRNWYFHNFEVIPARIRNFKISYPNKKDVLISRNKELAYFEVQQGEMKLSHQDQQHLNHFLEEGFFEDILTKSQSSLLENIKYDLTFSDFKGKWFKLSVGEEYSLEPPPKKKSAFKEGMISFDRTEQERMIPCRAIRYQSFSSEESVEKGDPSYTAEVIINEAQLEIFQR